MNLRRNSPYLYTIFSSVSSPSHSNSFHSILSSLLNGVIYDAHPSSFAYLICGFLLFYSTAAMLY